MVSLGNVKDALAKVYGFESFKSKEHFETKNNLITPASLAMFVIFAPWYFAMFLIWVRLIVAAFKCSAGEGVCAIVFYPLYKLWKFGSLIKMSCETTSIF